MYETSSEILEVKRRARDYWDIDGLPALLTGATTVLMGVLWLCGNPYASFFVLWFSLPLYSTNRKILEWLKGRITYPRTGYVAPPKEGDPDSTPHPYRMISITKEPVAPIVGRASRKAMGILSFPFIGLLWLFADVGWLGFLACLASALLFWRIYKEDPPWFEIAGSVIAGLIILLMEGPRRFGVFLLVFGAASMVKGATLLIRYVLRHPSPRA